MRFPIAPRFLTCYVLRMFIRKTTHAENKNGQIYHTYKLVESVRTDRGPRQRTVLNLGKEFFLPQENWKELADRIEAIISGQRLLFPISEKIEKLAQRYARRILREHVQKSPLPIENQSNNDFQMIDINTVENEQIRSIGGESVIFSTIKELELDRKFEDLGFTPSNIEAAIGVITARLLEPASERATHLWLQKETALDELMNTSFESISQDRVYKISDMLLKNKDVIEKHLREREKNLFNLEENILLYDLTNTFFEGSGKYNSKAHFGFSKEKRNDCPLVTLALLMDGDGFPKKSEIFEGNVCEHETLEKIVPKISTGAKKPIIVMDAGIGTQKNIDWLSDKKYDYIVVSRKRKANMPAETEMTKIRENNRRTIHAISRITATGEMEVICHSTAKEIKEQGIKNRFEKRFEEKLTSVHNAIGKKNGTKKYEKVLEKIGRLKEKYRRVSRRYDIDVEKDEISGNAISVNWRMKQVDDISGYYVLRTSLSNSNEKDVFDIFTMLLELEDAFRSMKSELGLRPIYHQTEFRCDGHLFITLLAYHILHSIRLKLNQNGIADSWSTIRNTLASHFRVTTSMKRSDGKMIYIRKTAKPEECHVTIYDALGLPHRPGKTSKTIL